MDVGQSANPLNQTKQIHKLMDVGRSANPLNQNKQIHKLFDLVHLANPTRNNLYSFGSNIGFEFHNLWTC